MEDSHFVYLFIHFVILHQRLSQSARHPIHRKLHGGIEGRPETYFALEGLSRRVKARLKIFSFWGSASTFRICFRQQAL
jgi:hypothetical protein